MNIIKPKEKHSFIQIILILLFLLLSFGCEFENPADFELPTWFVDIEFPLIHETYLMGDLVDSTMIFPHDSTGLQLIFESTLPRIEVDESYLELNFPNGYLEIQTPEASTGISYEFPSYLLDTTLVIPVTAAGATYFDINGNPFTVPLTSDQTLSADGWNQQIADIFNSVFQPLELLVEIYDQNDLPLPTNPEIIDEVTGLVIRNDPASYFQTTVRNAGIATSVNNANVELITGHTLPLIDTLALHNDVANITHNTQSVESTSLSNDLLKSWLAFNLDLGVETASDTVFMTTGDSLFIELRLLLSIPGADSAVVHILSTDITPELDPIVFPSEIEIYKGIYAGGETIPPNVNKLTISDLRNTYPFDIDFFMDFQNFYSFDEEEVKIDTVLSTDITYNYVFDLKSDTVRSSVYPNEPITELELDFAVVLSEQYATIPLNTESIGDLAMTIRLYDQKYESLEALIVEPFPTRSHIVEDIPQGMDGISFSDASLDFEMYNTITAPISIEIDLIGYLQFTDSINVNVTTVIDTTGISLFDSSKTIISLGRDGVTTYFFATPVDSIPSDSIFAGAEEGNSIVDLLSANPERMVINTDARIDGRVVLHPGTFVHGSYIIHAPFEVQLDEMHFIPANASYVADMDHTTRNRVRSSLYKTMLNAEISNTIPIGGNLALLFSNQEYFPLDTTVQMLNALKDTLVVMEGWDPTDEIFIVNSCSELDPSLGDYFIFNTMSDFSDCIDGMPYLIKRSHSGMDTVFAYIDTLLYYIIPDPVFQQSDTSFSFEINTDRIRLFTDIGGHFVMPVFNLNGTNEQPVYFNQSDQITVQSSLIMMISNTGMFDVPEDELIIAAPNGGETLVAGMPTVIRWHTLGDINRVTLDWGLGASPEWATIASDIPNIDSLVWTPSTYSISDSVRIRVKGDGTSDICGWYFRVIEQTIMNKQSNHIDESIGIRKGGIR